jgi:hypothetical protein
MEEEAWMTIKEGILVLEEREWIKEEDNIRLLKDIDNKEIELRSPITNLRIMREETARRMEEGTKNIQEKTPIQEHASKSSSQKEISKNGQSSQSLSRIVTGSQEEGVRKQRESGT